MAPLTGRLSPYPRFISQGLQVGDQVVELPVADFAQAGDAVGAMGAAQSFAQGLGAAVVKVWVFVVEPAQGRGVIAAVGVVALFETDFVDLPSVSSGPPWQVLQAALGDLKTSRPRWASAVKLPSGLRYGFLG